MRKLFVVFLLLCSLGVFAQDTTGGLTKARADLLYLKLDGTNTMTGPLELYEAAVAPTGAKGDLYYSTADDYLYYYNGSAWVKIAKSTDAVTAHGSLTQLDYASAGHTGFASSASLASYLPLAGGILTGTTSIQNANPSFGLMNTTSGASLGVTLTGGFAWITNPAGPYGMALKASGPYDAARVLLLPNADGTLWSSGNDGAASTLDADLLDGSHGSAFATSGHNHSGIYLPFVANAAGWLHNDGAGAYAWSTPSYSDVGALAVGGKAADSDKLDNIDSTGFSLSGHDHALTYLGISAKAADSDLLDGHDTAYFQVAGSYLTSEVDGVVGNEVTNATDGTLTRSGSGTGGSPYTLGINLGNANTWTNNVTITGPDNATPALAVTSGKTTQAGISVTCRTAATTGGEGIIVTAGTTGQTANLFEARNASNVARTWVDGHGRLWNDYSILGAQYVVGNDSLLFAGLNANGVQLGKTQIISWSDTASYYFSTLDTGLARSSAGVVKVTDGSTGYGNAMIAPLTAATMTAGAVGQLRGITSQYSWTNAMVVALGANLTGDVKVCTLPAKTVVKNAYIIIDTAASGTDTLTVSLGRTSATYLDYLGNGDAMAAANTVYGDAVGERGANLTGYDMPSSTATTDVYCHFVATDATGDTLEDILTSTGTVYLETVTLP